MIVNSHQRDISPDILQYYSISLIQHRIVLIHFLHLLLERPNDKILRFSLRSFTFNLLFSSLSKRVNICLPVDLNGECEVHTETICESKDLTMSLNRGSQG